MRKHELIDQMYNYLGINMKELEIRYKKILKQFTNNKEFPFLHIKCHSKSTFNHVKKIFQKKNVFISNFSFNCEMRSVLLI